MPKGLRPWGLTSLTGQTPPAWHLYTSIFILVNGRLSMAESADRGGRENRADGVSIKQEAFNSHEDSFDNHPSS